MTQPSEPLDYQIPVPAQRRPPVDVGTIVVCLLIASLLTFTPIFLVPRFEDIFRDFGMKLPLVTATLLQFSRAAIGGMLLLVWLLAAVPVAISIPLNPLGRRILRAFLYLVLVAIIVWIVLALFMPYVTLVNSVSGAKK